MSPFEPDYYESITYLLAFVQCKDPKASQSLPEFPNFIHSDVRQIRKLLELSRKLNVKHMSYKVDIALESVEYEWMGD